jgi:hypothetical protein
MNTAFVLHFQERCENLGDAQSAATQTSTAVHAEQIDSDPSHVRSAGLFETNAPFAGTGTVTKASAEGADEDPHTHRLRIIPINCEPVRASTQTMTFIAAEGPDADPQTSRREFLSECLLF